MPESKLVTYYQKGTYNESTGAGVEVYPKTHVDNVVGLEGEITKPLDGFDFAANPGALKGQYYVTNAVNSPFKSSGILTVMKDGNDYIELWRDDENVAYRMATNVNPAAAKINYLVVNNKVVDTSVLHDMDEDGIRVIDMLTYGTETVRTVVLKLGGVYTISGALTNVRITVGLDSSEEALCSALKKTKTLTKEQVQLNWLTERHYETTKISLSNLFMQADNYIATDDEDTALKNVIAAEPVITSIYPGNLQINLVSGSHNYLKRVMQGDMVSVNSKAGMIYCEGPDVLISGNGYLGIESMLGGHAIKSKHGLTIGSSDFSDAPHIKATAYHDILHGNDYLYVYNGYIKDVYSNDFLGADTAAGDQVIGKIRLYGGYFEMDDCLGTFLQADDAIVYPSVTIRYKNVGEGLWLQADPGLILQCDAEGNVTGYTNVDYQAKTFAYRKYKAAYPFLSFDASSATDTTKYPINSDKSIDQAFPGIIVFEGATLDKDPAGAYKESPRNTCMLSDTSSNKDSCKDGERFTPTRIFSRTPVPEIWAGSDFEGELAPTSGHDALQMDAGFDSIVASYSETIFGGAWHVGVKESAFEAYKKELDYTISCISSMIVPPKSFALTSQSAEFLDGFDGETFKENDDKGDFVEALAAFTNTKLTPLYHVESEKTFAPGDYFYSTKTGLTPTFHLHPGDVVNLQAVIDPDNVTNNQVKWTVGETNDFAVIGRIKSEDTQSCQVIGLQKGTEYLTVSLKGLTKKYEILSMKVKFVVEPAPAPEPEPEE